MTFQGAVRICLQRKYADPDGRARRAEFWFFALFTAIVRVVAGLIDSALGLPELGGSTLVGVPGPLATVANLVGGTGLLATVASAALLIPGLAVGARRLHDTGRSGGWLAFWLVPIVGWIVLIVFLAQGSDPKPNQHGPSPA